MKDFIHESCWKKKVFLAVMYNFGEGISRLKCSTSASYLLMVIWRDIYPVDPLEPSTLLLHRPLWKQKGQNDYNTFPAEPHKKFRFWLHSQDTGEKNGGKKCGFKNRLLLPGGPWNLTTNSLSPPRMVTSCLLSMLTAGQGKRQWQKTSDSSNTRVR